MNETPRWVALSGLLLLIAGAACAPRAPNTAAVSTTSLTSGEYDAARRIAAARCDARDQTCSSFPTRDACIHARVDPSTQEADLADCSEPIDEKRLQSCLEAVKQAPCASTLRDIKECRRGSLCPYIPEEGTQ